MQDSVRQFGDFFLQPLAHFFQPDHGAAVRAAADRFERIEGHDVEVDGPIGNGGDGRFGPHLGADRRGGQVLDVDRRADRFFAVFEIGAQSFLRGPLHEQDHVGRGEDDGAVVPGRRLLLAEMNRVLSGDRPLELADLSDR